MAAEARVVMNTRTAALAGAVDVGRVLVLWAASYALRTFGAVMEVWIAPVAHALMTLALLPVPNGRLPSPW